MTSSIPASLTPMSCRRAPAGLVSGPRKLKIVRSAMRKPAIWTSLASPAMITSRTPAASSALSDRPWARASMARVMTGSGIRWLAPWPSRPDAPLVGDLEAAAQHVAQRRVGAAREDAGLGRDRRAADGDGVLD